MPPFFQDRSKGCFIDWQKKINVLSCAISLDATSYVHYTPSIVNFELNTDLLRSYPLKLLTGIPLNNTVKLLFQNFQSTNEARVAIC